MAKFKPVREITPDRRIWVIRADSGRFIPNFRQDGCAAVGFLDDLDLENNQGRYFFRKTEDTIKSLSSLENYKDDDGETKHRRVESHAHQTRRFLFEMTPGDWVITPVKSRVHLGRITGHPYLSKEPITYREDEKSKPIVMNFNLRRKINWGPIIYRMDFPHPVRKALFARMSVYNIDAHSEIIYHLIYPYFNMENRLHLSFSVNQRERINNYSARQLLELINISEVVGVFFHQSNWRDLDFDQFLEQYFLNGNFSATTKAQFFSQGDVWSAFKNIGPNTKNGLAIAFLASSVIFGNNLIGFDGVIDIDMRHKIFDIIEKYWNQEHGIETQNKLKLGMPNFDTSELESDKLDSSKLPEQIKKEYENEFNYADI